MAYTKYSLTPASNTAAPPNGAPEGMLPSAVNDTMRDMMAQIRDVGDGIRGGTYTMTAPVITGGSVTGVALSGNTFTNPVITGGSINDTPIGATTANTGAFTTASLKGSTSGTITLDAPAVAGTNTATLPAATGTVMVSGAMPAFSAYNTGSQAISTATATKVTLQNEDFDTANCFDSTTNYRFTPNVAGYYQINGTIYISSTITTHTCLALLYKNGSVYQSGAFQSTSTASTNAASQVSSVVYFNGTTDYIELWAYASIGGTGSLTNAGALGLQCQFSGSLVRAA